MPHFQNQREDAQAMTDQNKKLDRMIELLEHMVGKDKGAPNAYADKAADLRKKAEAAREKHKAETAKPLPRPAPPTQNDGLFAPDAQEPRSAPERPALQPHQMTVQGRNDEMTDQSGLEQQSQRENIFHRDVQSKD